MKISKLNLYILTFVVFVVRLGYSIIVPIIPFYIESIGAGGTELGLLVASYSVMRLIFGPIWGGLSDRVGRKPILIIGIIGFAVSMIWFGLATKLWVLFASRVLAGILSSATTPTTMAYIGDSTSDEERSTGMGLLGMAGGVGAIFGPMIGGFLAEKSLPLPFFVAAGLALISLIFAIIFLPESNPSQEKTTEQKGIINLRAWWQALHSPVGFLFLLTFVSTCGLMMFVNVFGLYGLLRFNYGTKQVGIIMMVFGLVSALAQGLLAGPVVKRLGEGPVIKIGLATSVIGFFLMMLANTFTQVLLSTAYLALAVSIQTPALFALTSRRSSAPQGITMGLSNSFVSLGFIVGPILGGVTLDMNLNLPYLSGAVIMLLAFLMSLAWGKLQ